MRIVWSWKARFAGLRFGEGLEKNVRFFGGWNFPMLNSIYNKIGTPLPSDKWMYNSTYKQI